MSSWIFAVIIAFNFMKMASSTEGNEKISGAAQSCCKFTSDYYKVVTQKLEGNVVTSPFGMHLALSYLSHGSDKHTAREMTAGLHLSNAEELHTQYKDIIKTLDSMGAVELNIVNALFLQEGLKLYETFQSKGTNFYNFTVRNVDFGDSDASSKSINSWVLENTQNKIKNIISPDDINDYTKVVLANAIYFKGQWRHAFNVEHTEKRTFYLTGTQNKKVPTMFKEFKYFQGEIPSFDARFIEIPYVDQGIDMIIVLPNEIEGLKFIEKNFDWNAIVETKSVKRLTRLYLPKFRVEATLDLKNILPELGFTSMFDDTANFTKMSALPLKVDSVVQKAFIDVNEFGTEATAATVVRMMMKRSLDVMMEEPVDFSVDRPFIVAIRHVADNTPLFLSSVRDITVTPEKDEL